jgi:hypothetical protein
VAAIDVADLEGDDAAMVHGRLLCEQRKASVRLEIWQDERLVIDSPYVGGRSLKESRPVSSEAPLGLVKDVADEPFAKARCPATGHLVRTHARLTAVQISKLKTSVIYWCRDCGCAHEAGRDDLIA